MKIKNIVQIAILVCLFLTQFGCKKNNNPVSPSDVTLMYASFEANGAPSLNDWQYTQLGNSSYVTFSHDVPSGGGSWSLSLQCDTVYNSGVTNCFHFNNSNDNDVYVLSYWAKCVGFSQGRCNSQCTVQCQRTALDPNDLLQIPIGNITL